MTLARIGRGQRLSTIRSPDRWSRTSAYVEFSSFITSCREPSFTLLRRLNYSLHACITWFPKLYLSRALGDPPSIPRIVPELPKYPYIPKLPVRSFTIEALLVHHSFVWGNYLLYQRDLRRSIGHQRNCIDVGRSQLAQDNSRRTPCHSLQPPLGRQTAQSSPGINAAAEYSPRSFTHSSTDRCTSSVIFPDADLRDANLPPI